MLDAVVLLPVESSRSRTGTPLPATSEGRAKQIFRWFATWNTVEYSNTGRYDGA